MIHNSVKHYGLLTIHGNDMVISQVAASSTSSQVSLLKSRGEQKNVSIGNCGKLSTSRMSTQPRCSAKQRLHPGMVSSQDRATAHYGAVTGLKTTEDSMYLLSAGCLSSLLKLAHIGNAYFLSGFCKISICFP